MEDFKSKLTQISERIGSLKEQIQTEEATKNAFIMPFIQLLGYDVFNPTEVVPEFIADHGIKKGEKVDYAIFINGKPEMIIECKSWKENIDHHSSQLARYFHTLDCKFALLTNGIKYHFFTDLVKVNVMDEKPFLKFDITDITEFHYEEIYKFHKSFFNIENIVNTASKLKCESELKGILVREFENPSEAFLKHFIGQVYEGRATEKVVNDFKLLFSRASNFFIQDHIKKKLNIAFEQQTPTVIAVQEIVEDIIDTSSIAPGEEKTIETTIEEIEAFYIVKSILRTKTNSSRIIMRDTHSYCGVLLDDNNRKPICRFWFNAKKKYLGLFDDQKKETRFEITALDDI
ncbi:MAG: type I restriction endonuclease [Bacteroidetes bacterium]|nr:type I restriction endonuclease [Bacteroidota bacterium]